MDPLLILFGLLVGILVGLTGMGGGSLMTPLLILVFGIKPVTAIGTDIFYGAVTKTVGGARHFRQRTVDLSLSKWMAFGSVPAAVGGVFALKAIEHATGKSFEGIVLAAVGGALLFAGTVTLVRLLALPGLDARERQSAAPTRANRIAAVVVGVFVGFVLGFTSAGSGTLIGVALILVFRLVPQRVVGTDVFHAGLMLWAAAVAHVAVGDVNFALAGTIMLGSVPGVWLGSLWAVRVPTASLRAALAVLVLGGGVGLIAKAGVGIPTPALAAIPVLVAVLVLAPAARRAGRRLVALSRGTRPA